jgi:hypothetical protein
LKTPALRGVSSMWSKISLVAAGIGSFAPEPMFDQGESSGLRVAKITVRAICIADKRWTTLLTADLPETNPRVGARKAPPRGTVHLV